MLVSRTIRGFRVTLEVARTADSPPDRYEAQVFDGWQMVDYGPNRATVNEAKRDACEMINRHRWVDVRVRNTRTGEFVTP